MRRYEVLINGIGRRNIMAKDIDDAYVNACKQYGCTIDDILAVTCIEPFKPEE